MCGSVFNNWPAPKYYPLQIAVGPNGKYILTASLDCTVKRCPLPKAERGSKKKKKKTKDDSAERRRNRGRQRRNTNTSNGDGSEEASSSSKKGHIDEHDDSEEEEEETQASLNVDDEDDNLTTVTFKSHKSQQTHDSGVLCMCISPDSNHVVTGGADGNAYHWIMERRFFKKPHVAWLSQKELADQIAETNAQLSRVDRNSPSKAELEDTLKQLNRRQTEKKAHAGTNNNIDDEDLDTNPLHYADLDHTINGSRPDDDDFDVSAVSQIYKVVANKKTSSTPFVITAADDNILRKFLFDVQRAQQHTQKKWTPHRKQPQLIFGGDGKFGHVGKINALEMTNDDRYLITGSSDELVKIWDVHNGDQLRAMSSSASPQFNEFHRSPRFTCKLPSGILSIEVDSTNEGVLLVGLAPQSRVQGDEAYKETLYAIPQLNALLYEGVIPSSFLELMARVDEKRTDPDEKYRNVRRALKKESSPMATSLASKAFYQTLADEANTMGLVKTLFDFDDYILAATIPYSHLLESARYGHEMTTAGFSKTSTGDYSNDSGTASGKIFNVAPSDTSVRLGGAYKGIDWIRVQLATEVGSPTWSRDYAQCIREILRNAQQSVVNHNMVHAHTNKPRLQHSGYNIDHGHMVMQLTGPTGTVEEGLASYRAYFNAGFRNASSGTRSKVGANASSLYSLTKGLLESFPDQVLSFLSKVPNMRSNASVNHPGYGLSANMKGNSMLVLGAKQCMSQSLWYNSRVKDLVSLQNTWGSVWRSSSAKGVRKRGTESCVLPWPHFASGSMLLRKLLDTNDTDFFAPTIVVALVQHKWQEFGRPRFTQDLLVYVVSLILIVTASIINRIPGVMEQLYRRHDSPHTADGHNASNPITTLNVCSADTIGCRYSYLMAFIMAFFIFKSAVYDANREWLQVKHGPKGYYFKDRFNVGLNSTTTYNNNLHCCHESA